MCFLYGYKKTDQDQWTRHRLTKQNSDWPNNTKNKTHELWDLSRFSGWVIMRRWTMRCTPTDAIRRRSIVLKKHSVWQAFLHAYSGRWIWHAIPGTQRPYSWSSNVNLWARKGFCILTEPKWIWQKSKLLSGLASNKKREYISRRLG